MTTHKGGIVYKYVEGSRPETDDTECVPPNSRVCITVSSRAGLSEQELYRAFSPFGEIEYLKVLNSKPVAFVKFSLASSAELAIESADQIIVGGEVPKAFMAETRAEQGKGLMQAHSLNPEDHPPRSRLFVVLSHPGVTVESLEQIFASFPGFEAIKKSERKAVAFVKYGLASEAAAAMESVLQSGHPDIRNILPAEPRAGGALHAAGGMLAPPPQRGGAPPPYASAPRGPPQLSYSQPPPHVPMGAQPPPRQPITDSPPSQRLFIVTGRNVYHEDLSAAMAHLPELEYIDVKLTPMGTPRGFAYAFFSSVDAAANAMAALDGFDVLGLPLKVVFAEDRGKGAGKGVGKGAGKGLAPGLRGPPPPAAPLMPFAKQRAPPQPMGGFPTHEVTINDDIPRQVPEGVDPDYPPGSRLFYVLAPGCVISEDSLVSLFRRYPGLEYLQPQGASKTYGFAKYDNPDSAGYALQELNMKQLGAGTMKVVLAHPTSERGPKKRPREF